MSAISLGGSSVAAPGHGDRRLPARRREEERPRDAELGEQPREPVQAPADLHAELLPREGDERLARRGSASARLPARGRSRARARAPRRAPRERPRRDLPLDRRARDEGHAEPAAPRSDRLLEPELQPDVESRRRIPPPGARPRSSRVRRRPPASRSASRLELVERARSVRRTMAGRERRARPRRERAARTSTQRCRGRSRRPRARAPGSATSSITVCVSATVSATRPPGGPPELAEDDRHERSAGAG